MYNLIRNWGVVCKPFKDIVTGLRYLSIFRSVLIDKLKYKVYQKSNQVQCVSKIDLVLFQFFLAFELMLNMNVGHRNSSYQAFTDGHPVCGAIGQLTGLTVKMIIELVISAVWSFKTSRVFVFTKKFHFQERVFADRHNYKFEDHIAASSKVFYYIPLIVLFSSSVLLGTWLNRTCSLSGPIFQKHTHGYLSFPSPKNPWRPWLSPGKRKN